ncbi:Glutamate-ammonia-ligase adenylyltransferase [hydrothermal vent metagenome]|uniref:Glutamate-ammonia-ligase adenylyltransferase n=1 Tax=hydrothermal vent metagenome TaxID=652676 RepID=A0A3B0Z0S2_9ZZZZ
MAALGERSRYPSAVARKTKKPAQTAPWEDLPKILRPPAQQRWETFESGITSGTLRRIQNPAFQRVLCQLFAISEFVAELCIRSPHYIEELLDSGDLLADSWPGGLPERVRRQLRDCPDEIALKRLLRQTRQREMLRIAWRDLAGWASLAETLGDLSDLADACIEGALEQLTAWQAAETPPPLREGSREPAPLVVLAMGKLGAHELNFSSDIDLIFTYPEAHKPARRKKALSPEQYFTRLGQSLIQVLSDHDADGFVFRVDMRLRPYGSAGALVCSYDALEEYYQSQGREWERYAMIKARPVSGDEDSRRELMELLRPFVFRRYLDFQAFDALRDLKRQIRKEVERRDQQDNIKLGPGGIREIEFIVQAFQLVRGGREPQLRQRRVLDVLPALVALNLLPQQSATQLAAAYHFLRRAENHLQALHDQQVHHLPESDSERARLALSMDFPDWKRFIAALNGHRRRVETHFEQVFDLPQQESTDEDDALRGLWLEQCDRKEALQQLGDSGYDNPVEALRWIEQMRRGTVPRYLGEQGRIRFDALVPRVIAAVGLQPQAAEVLGRLVAVLEHIAGRTTYIALLQEHPLVLSQLVRLCAASAWIADQIARFPMLLDQLLDPRSLYTPLSRQALQSELEHRLSDVEETDLELQMDRLRQFHHAMVLRVAAADIAGAAQVMVVSDELTAIAEVVLDKVLSIAWADMLRRYGEPSCKVRRKTRPVAFAVIGYGKLGGIELGYGSDLDLVFLHDSTGSAQRTRGRKPVDNTVFFTRLGQRMIHMLEAFTGAGLLYEVDMRLRPSGNSGLLVSDIDAFADYQLSEAWTWEHQALVRARLVAGDRALEKPFQKVRGKALAACADQAGLREQVRDMRERMRRELGSRGAGFHLKQDPGGIVDIEFMVQYLVLRWSEAHPALLGHTDTINLLKVLAREGLLKSAYAQILIEAYQQYRSVVHRLTLAEARPVIEDDRLDKPRNKVARLWRELMED